MSPTAASLNRVESGTTKSGAGADCENSPPGVELRLKWSPPVTDRTPFPLPARPTTYRGIKMRSRLEAEFAAALDTWPDMTWEYEPMCFASPAGQYLPDFLVTYHPPSGFRPLDTYFEVKAVVDDPQPVLSRMEIIWDSRPDVDLTLLELRGECRTWSASGSRNRTWKMERDG